MKSILTLLTLLSISSCNNQGENTTSTTEITKTEINFNDMKNNNKTKYKIIDIDGIDIFYREAGAQNKQTILLLHGFPSSSHMYRDVIEQLADKYHLIAPDYPGFGLSEAPPLDEYEYSFENISSTIDTFIDKLGLSSFYVMMQDYGGPIGYRIASRRPQLIEGLIIQNANIYNEGLGEWATKIGGYVQANDMNGLTIFKNHLMSPEGIKEQYITGAKNPEKISHISYLTDAAFIQREGIHEIQSTLFNNYGTNFPKYPEWQDYLKEKQPKTLVVWGENDKFFSKAGGEAYQKDLQDASIHFFNSGHFMLEEYASEVTELIKEFIN